ncbi:TPA: hypothetical protein HA231_00785 [Candidatus Woesearchaeota archaeon]|nr:hypothetical protein [Candidatus Woesearchaeota archaeon]
MKISIDTREDSPEDIRKLIKMLLALIGESAAERTPPASGEGLFDMFGNPDSPTSEQQQLGGGTDVNDFIDKAGDEGGRNSDDDNMKVVPY